MRIGINATVLTASHLCGIGHSLFHLLEALVQTDASKEYHLIAGKEILHFPKGNNIYFHKVPERGLSYVGMSKAIRDLRCDLAFIPGEVVPLGMSVPTVITVYDIFPLKCSSEAKKEISFKNKLHFFLAKRLHFKRASSILAISEDTKKDIINYCNIPPDKIHVTPLGVKSEEFYPRPAMQVDAILEKYGINSPYFINVSSVWWARKNLLRLIEAFAAFSSKIDQDCSLVITGNRGPSYEAMKALIQRFSLENKVKLLDYIDRADMPSLLSSALGLVFPSLDEGFGLPMLEAMSCGCPVITSHVSALPEVGGDAALYVDPLRIDSIEEAMHALYHDASIRKRLIEKGVVRARGFSWENTARLSLQAFSHIYKK
jgi:glycosyltransferase involved in cell wall biosynthesis